MGLVQDVVTSDLIFRNWPLGTCSCGPGCSDTTLLASASRFFLAYSSPRSVPGYQDLCTAVFCLGSASTSNGHLLLMSFSPTRELRSSRLGSAAL